MNQSQCGAGHKCSDGGEGGCSQPGGHYGRHLCGSCLGFFGGGEAIRSGVQVNDPAGSGLVGPADGPGAGGGYDKGPGLGGGYGKSPGLGGGYDKGPGSGGGYVTDSNGPGVGQPAGETAYCAYCHVPLERNDPGQSCPHCGHRAGGGEKSTPD